eukprot:4776390-Amphidinium_carterae.2
MEKTHKCAHLSYSELTWHWDWTSTAKQRRKARVQTPKHSLTYPKSKSWKFMSVMCNGSSKLN